MQDYLPYLYFARDLLYNNKHIKIICTTSNKYFDSFEFIIKNILNLSNEILFLNINYNMDFKELYEIKLNGPFSSGLFPYIGHCTCPVILYKNLRNYILNNYLISIKYEPKYLIYTRRNTGNKSRYIINEDYIINLLQSYCKITNLEFINFYYNDYKLDDRVKLFYNAKIIIGVHGSANFHTLFCNNNVKIIEFICIKDCHSTQLVNLAYNFNYWQIPIPEYGQFEKIIKISDDSIKSMNKILLYN